MSDLNFVIEGGEEIARWLADVAEAGDVVEAATLAAAAVVRDEAGAILGREGVESELIGSTSKGAEAVVAPSTEQWYLKFFETGTDAHEIVPDEAGALAFPGGAHPFAIGQQGGMAARPFLRPAADGKGDEAAGAAGDVFRERIDEAA